ncbi:MAG: hypothetical protein IIA33_09945 [Planctomycetes bacterium]|nr:hypothetical protein [Planctomycetota bacterium]
MPLNTQGDLRRQREIRATQKRRTTQPQRSELVNAAQGLMRVVLRSVDDAAGTMFFHRLRYSTSPPEVGKYETFGDLERGYPLECAKYKDY